MPREVQARSTKSKQNGQKAGTAAKKTASPAAAPSAPKPKATKKNKLYALPKSIPKGTVLEDKEQTKWIIGGSIGQGGFGEIYAAKRQGEKEENFVIKSEPKDNGTLFVEMHFYMRHATLDAINKFMKSRGLKSIGVPHMVAWGSSTIDGENQRFIVLKRYGQDLNKYLTDNGGVLPIGTLYRLAIQMLDAYQFIHSCNYVHADLKASNILVGEGKGPASQAYLLDFGLVAPTKKQDYKPDPKKSHNGTIEFTSRDAHLGITAYRGDLEILGYNLIVWSGGKLPWVEQNLLAKPAAVQKAKEQFMETINTSLKKAYASDIKMPAPLFTYMKYVAKMQSSDMPDYDMCRKIFGDALKALKLENSGPLQFKQKLEQKTKDTPKKRQAQDEEKPSTSKKARRDLEKRNKAAMSPTTPRRLSSRLNGSKSQVSFNEITSPAASDPPASSPQSPPKKQTPNKKAGDSKIYFALNLDVAADASVVLTVNRKDENGEVPIKVTTVKGTPNRVHVETGSKITKPKEKKRK